MNKNQIIRSEKMNYSDALVAAAGRKKIYRACVSGSVWSAGQMVAVDDTIGFYTTLSAAREACRDYEMIQLDARDRKTLRACVETCDAVDYTE